MSFFLAGARFQLERALGLCRRGFASLRTRGAAATWQRVSAQLGLFAPASAETLRIADTSPFAPFALPASEAPEVSIVIPVHGHADETIACLRAIATHPPRASFEVIVVDDASPDDTLALLSQVDGVQLHALSANQGFIGACNAGAALAHGRFLLFLNNDTVPQPGWLDALRATFDAQADVGIVGAQLVYPDGRLQEAGAMLARDGRGESRGRFADPTQPAFAWCADVDYVSGAALMLERGLFEHLGGFDTRYAPAYYEDTDLAFRVREAGLRVLVQPAARVVHLEGVSAGTDPAQGMKAAQARNLPVFEARWRDALASRPIDPVAAGQLPRPGTPQVLIVDNLTPSPDRDSASLRLVNLMRMLRDAGAHVVFLPADRRHGGDATRALQALGVEAWYDPHVGGVARWMRTHGGRFQRVLLCRHYIAREFLPLVRAHAPQARVVFDSIDLHYVREQRGAEIANDASLLRAAARTRSLELDVVARADETLVVSAAEAEMLSRDAPEARVTVLSNLHEVAGAGTAFAQRRDLVFVGGFRHPPNVDGMRWFLGDVFPRIRAALPDVRFHCIGGYVPDAIAAFSTAPGVHVHGHVPDIGPYMDGCRIAVAPLRFGAGVKGKVNLSMAHGQPVVATPCAAEGMYLRDGEDVLLAEDADAFAEAVIALYRDEALWSRLSGNGLANVQAHFSLDAARDTVRRVFFDGARSAING
ncbi:glycosyltransferase [Luteimonas sp. 3794]|uniref:glycosyltransferase n=1 Tax=Luteimonas sp. 3794 TaxID=2817730 RepID=UPI002858E07D|nr:glycosyltransferase [Luteimonas sp. 3794]MDR6991233.1 GT2 family glycosyltransferase/glycosyltransferase involved in cell wall biosynthesis [Luteimonas sp. 3794]